MVKVNTIGGKLLFSYNEEETNLSNEIKKQKYLREVNLKGGELSNIVIEDTYLHGANFNYVKLENVTFKNCDLSDVDFSHAIFKNVKIIKSEIDRSDFSYTNFKGGIEFIDITNFDGLVFRFADLSGFDFSNKRFRFICFNHAILRNVNLSGATITESFIDFVNLTNTNLSNTTIIGVTFDNTDFTGADISGANILSSSFCRANLLNIKYNEATSFKRVLLLDAKNIPRDLPYPLACPETGKFEAWKKVVAVVDDDVINPLHTFLVKLEIPEDAKRLSSYSNKCRCDKAKVLEIIDLSTNKQVSQVLNCAYRLSQTLYKVGEMVYPDSFDEDRWNECSNGIHFFKDKESAMYY